MKTSLVASLIVSLVVAMATSEATRVASLISQSQLLAKLVLIPWLGIAAALCVAQFIAPRRLFDEQPRALARVTLGLSAGILAGAVSVFGLAVLDPGVPEPLTVGVAGLCSGLICSLGLARVRPRACRACGYDLRGLGSITQCPECGVQTLHPCAGGTTDSDPARAANLRADRP